jgi:hypothetical protein
LVLSQFWTILRTQMIAYLIFNLFQSLIAKFIIAKIWKDLTRKESQLR